MTLVTPIRSGLHRDVSVDEEQDGDLCGGEGLDMCGVWNDGHATRCVCMNRGAVHTSCVLDFELRCESGNDCKRQADNTPLTTALQNAELESEYVDAFKYFNKAGDGIITSVELDKVGSPLLTYLCFARRF